MPGIHNRVNSDCQKLRRFALQLLAAGYAAPENNAWNWNIKIKIKLKKSFFPYLNIKHLKNGLRNRV